MDGYKQTGQSCIRTLGTLGAQFLPLTTLIFEPRYGVVKLVKSPQ